MRAYAHAPRVRVCMRACMCDLHVCLLCVPCAPCVLCVRALRAFSACVHSIREAYMLCMCVYMRFCAYMRVCMHVNMCAYKRVQCVRAQHA